MLLSLLLLLFQAPSGDLDRPVVNVIVGELSATTGMIQLEWDRDRLSAFAGEGAAAGWIQVHMGGGFNFKQELTQVLAGPSTLRLPIWWGLAPNAVIDWTCTWSRYPNSPSDRGENVLLAKGSFRTLPGQSASQPLNFVVLNCMNQHYFLNGGQGRPAYQGEDKALGFPGLEAIDELDPAFVIFAGDSVYYDRPANKPATDAESMRAHWQRLFAQPRMRKLLASTATYWLKDDHDHRFNDSDQTGEKLPSHELGRKIFREQVPIVELDDDESPTWRTVRVSKDLQIWMTEGRDHRSPNSMPDGPEKSMWGVEQREWLKRTLLESDASFKVLVSPTPLVGPDDGYKSDNQTNPKGFRTEGEAFHAWLAEQKLNDAGFVVICGDRHWQYHSVHPQGTHEFAVGALIDANARLGRKPGDPKSTDPEAQVKQHYSSKKPSGGFLEVRLETEPTLHLELVFRDERGIELYRVQRKP